MAGHSLLFFTVLLVAATTMTLATEEKAEEVVKDKNSSVVKSAEEKSAEDKSTDDKPAETTAEEVVNEQKFVDKKFDQHGVPVCVKPKPCKGRECKTPCHNGKCHPEGHCVCDDCWEQETCNAYSQTQECSDKLERSVPQEDREHDEDEHDMGDNPYQDGDQETRPKKRRKRSGKRRKKRALKKPYSASKKFKLEKLGKKDNKVGDVDIQIGSKRSFRLTIQLPEKAAQDMLVELFTPDNETTIMLLCNVQVSHQGSKISADNGMDLTKLVAVMDARVGVWPYDRAILQFPKLTVVSGATAKTDLEVVITFDAIMINFVVDGKVYWVSAGAEYDSSNQIWVGQASFKTKTGPLLDTGSIKSTFKTLNPYSTTGNGLPVGESGQLTLEMQIPHYQVPVAIDAIAPLNTSGIVSICGILVYQTELSYHCVPKNVYQWTSVLGPDGECNSRARLDLRNVTNAQKREVGWAFNADDTIKIGIYIQFKGATAGTKHWIGVAVTVGDKQIYATQAGVYASGADPSKAVDSTPVVNFKANSSDAAPVGGSIKFVMTIQTEENKNSDMTVEFIMPVKTTARMHICKVEICANGWNVPCLLPEKPAFTSKANDALHDRVQLKLGHVRNHGVLKGNASASTITICLYATVTPHAENIKDAKIWVTAGLIVGKTKMWVGQKEITVSETKKFDTKFAPTTGLRYAFGTSQQYIGGLADVRFDITTKGQFKYNPMDLEIMLPFETGAAVLSICHVELLYAGKNMPCLNRAKVNGTFKLHSKANNTVYDRATVTLGDVYNVIGDGGDSNKTHSMITVRTVIKIEDHPKTNATLPSKTDASAGIIYVPSSLWVGSLTFDVNKPTNVPLTTAQAALLVVHLQSGDSSTEVTQGEAMSMQLIVNFPPESTSMYTVKVKVDRDTCTICRIAVKSTGHNMKCTKIDGKPVYTQFTTGGKGNQDGTIDMGIITNPGGERINGTKAEKSAIVFDVALKVASSQAVASSINLDAEVTYYEGGSLKTKTATRLTLTVKAAGAANTTAGTEPEFKFHMAPTLDNNGTAIPSMVVPGQHFRCFIDIVLKPGSCVKLNGKFMGPLGKDGALDITNVRVWGIGSSMPCTALNSGPPALISKRTGSTSKDIGSLDIGQVCSFAKDGSPAEFRTIRVEVIGRIRIDANPVNAGEEFWFSTVFKINGDKIYVSQLKMKLGDINNFVDVENANASANASIYYDTGSTAINKKIREIVTLPVAIMVPPNSTCKANIDVKAEMNGTATLHILEVKFKTCGDNLKGMCGTTPEDKYNITIFSSKGTTQHDRALIGPLIITNTGVTYRKGAAKPADDDKIVLEVKVQLMDALKMDQNAAVWVSTGVKLCKYIMIADKKITVSRENTYAPIYDVTATTDKNSYTKADKMTVTGTMKHAATSRAEGQNVHLKFFIPKFMYYDGGFTSSLKTTQVNFTQNYFAVMWSQFLFTDTTTYSVKFGFKDTLPSNQDSCPACTVPVEAGSDMHNRTGNTASEDFIPSPMISFKYQLSGMKGAPKTCTPVDLGLDTTTVKDCQITTTTEEDPAYPVKNIRKSAPDGFKPLMRKGAEDQRYVQVFFWEKTIISEVTFYPSTKATCEVTKIRLKYSNDLMGWVQGQENSVVVYKTAAAATKIADGESARARAVRIYPTEDNCGTTTKLLLIKFDLKGCPDPSNKPADRSDPCAYKPLSSQTHANQIDSGHREFVASGANTYFCDANPTKSLEMNCYSSSTSAGASKTKGMSKMAAHVIGYDTVHGELYATGQGGNAYLCSTDGGKTFFTVTQERWNKCKNDPKCAQAQKVPWDSNSQSSSPKFKQSTWGGDEKGLYKQSGSKWELVTDWTKCCT